jgi:AgrD protein
MKSKLMKVFLTFGAAIFTLLAFSTSASACFVGYYQPNEPKSLREE